MDKKNHILRITKAALEQVDPYKMISRTLSLEGTILSVRTGANNTAADLRKFGEIIVIGAGKATAPMAKAVEEIIGGYITAGVIAVKPGHTVPLTRIRTIEAGHPVPDGGSIRAAAEITELAESAGPQTLVINLLSGGGSALLAGPFQSEGLSLSLEDMQQTTRLLLESGAAIEEMNCIRKHLSSIKGGRLAELLYPAQSITLVLSDVVGDDLQSIASGPTVPDGTTFQDALEIVKKYGLEHRLPEPAAEMINKGCGGEIPDTPKASSRVFTKTENVLIGTNSSALSAASEKASKLGYTTVTLTSKLTGEAREAAKFFSAIAADIAGSGLLCRKPACILCGGETTVTIRGNGKGGRNQEMALAFLEEIRHRPELFPGVLFASVATDGNDGPTDAAGAFASADLLRKAGSLGLDIGAYLRNNDSYTFFDRTGGLIKTGPTNTNVCDIQILLIT